MSCTPAEARIFSAPHGHLAVYRVWAFRDTRYHPSFPWTRHAQVPVQAVRVCLVLVLTLPVLTFLR